MKKFAIFCLSLALMPSFASAAMLYRQLQVGSQGSDVSDLQTFLATDASVYPGGLVTGYFGLLTKAAVMRFQAANGISQVGRVGPQTMAAINAQMTSGDSFSENAPGFTTSLGLTESNAVVTFNVNTDIPTRVVVYYSTSPLQASENDSVRPITVSVSGTGVQENANLQLSHNVASLPLQHNTVYYAMAVATDANGVVSVLKPSPFRTNAF